MMKWCTSRAVQIVHAMVLINLQDNDKDWDSAVAKRSGYQSICENGGSADSAGESPSKGQGVSISAKTPCLLGPNYAIQ